MPYGPQNTSGPSQQPPRAGQPMPPYQSGRIPMPQNPGQSGQIPPVPQPYQSGQIPPVAAPQQPYPAAQQTAPLPVMHAQPVGQVIGAHTPSQRSGGSSLLRVGIIAAIVAALLLIVSLVLVVFKPFGLFEEQLEVDRPSTATVEDAFEDATIPEPNLSTFAYVDDEDLERKSMTNYKAGEVQYNKSGGSPQAYCEATAEATYENDSVSVKQPLTMRMDYDKEAQEWKPGSVREGTLSATPEGAADIDAITENFLNILKTYDAQVAAMYVGAEVTSTSTLTAKGGTAAFTATKTEGETTKTCTANADVTWSDTSGWNVEITSVAGDIEPPATETPETPAEEPPAEVVTPEPVSPNPDASGSGNSGSGSGSSGNTGDGATMGLVCFTGELVEVPGTIHFDNSGAILLKTDARYRVILDGRTYVVDYFEINANGSYHNGQHVVIIGEISYRGAVANAPLFINANYN